MLTDSGLEHIVTSRAEAQPIAGWSSLVARRAHNPKVAGSNPAPATINSNPDLRKQARVFALKAVDSRRCNSAGNSIAEKRDSVTRQLNPAPSIMHTKTIPGSSRQRFPRKPRAGTVFVCAFCNSVTGQCNPVARQLNPARLEGSALAAEKVSEKASDHDGGNVSLLDFFIMIREINGQ